MNNADAQNVLRTRRAFLGRAAGGLGAAALAAMLNSAKAASADLRPASRGIVRPLHFAPKAKRVIWLYQSGGPTHLETFDYKPQLAKLHGQPMPESFTRGKPIAQLQGQNSTASDPSTSSKSLAPAASRFASSFRISARSPTSSALSVR